MNQRILWGGVVAGLFGSAAFVDYLRGRSQKIDPDQIHEITANRDKVGADEEFHVSRVAYGSPCILSGSDRGRPYYKEIVGGSIANCPNEQPEEMTDRHRQIFEKAQARWAQLAKFFTSTRIRNASSCHTLTETDWERLPALKTESDVAEAVVCKLGESASQPEGEATLVVESLYNRPNLSARVYLNAGGIPQPPAVFMDASWFDNVTALTWLHVTGSLIDD